jgi:hypothetical protein
LLDGPGKITSEKKKAGIIGFEERIQDFSRFSLAKKYRIC